MKNKKNKKNSNINLIKSQVLPLLITVMVFVFLLFFMLIGEKKLMNSYLVSTKTREACLQTSSIYADIQRNKALENNDVFTNLCTDYLLTYDSLVGIQVETADGTTMITGQSFPDDLLLLNDYLTKAMAFVDLSNPIYLDKKGNNSLYRGLTSDFNYLFAIEPIRGSQDNRIFSTEEQRVNTIVGNQDYWVFFDSPDGSKVYIGYTVPLTDNDYMLCYLFDTGYKMTRVLIFIIAAIFIIRIIKSQKRIVSTYFRDNETLGKNWYFFLDRVDLTMSRNHKRNYAMFSIVLENYHSYCSCFGAKEGRNLIKNIYNTLEIFLPKNTLFARHEGADFCVYIKDVSKNDSYLLAQRMMEALHNIDSAASLNFLIGIYCPEEGEDIDAQEAHNLSYIASTQTKADNNIVFFSNEMKEKIEWDKKMEADFHRAIKNHEFIIYLQPKVDVNSKKYVAAEALVRWEHPTEGFLPPYKFIPVFEETGLISELDDYMIEEVAAIISKRLKNGKPVVPISVNLSRMHFINKNLASNICELVDKYEVPHKYIELELTESAFFDDKDLLIQTANKLRTYGFSVSLDDFGSGYSSLNSLRELPINIVKLDSGFFRGKELDDKGKIIVSEIIALAKQLNMQIVAEGIENANEVDFLSNLNCDLIQGFYFAKPMPYEEMEQLLDSVENTEL